MTMMRASPEQLKRTKLEEGIRLHAYQCTANKWTIGWGHASTNPIPVRGMRIVYQKDEDGKELRDPTTHKLIPCVDENGRPILEFYQGRVCEGVQITASEAERLFEADTEDTERGLNGLLTVGVEQNQFDALFDFVHQYGLHKLDTSTLLIRLNFNPYSPAVISELMRWTRDSGEHREYVWRRTARRVCIYTGSPIPQLLWSKCKTEREPNNKGFPFFVKDDEIDYSITPTIEKLIALGQEKAAPYKFDPDKIQTPQPADLAPVSEDALGGDERKPLDLDNPITLPSEVRAAPGVHPEAEAPAPVEHASPPVVGVSPDPSPTPIPPRLQREPAAADARPSGPPPQVVPQKPPPLPKDAAPADVTDPKDMVLSRRFWGLLVTALGTTNFLPRATSDWINNEGNRELLTWIVVVIIGFALYKYGQRKASRPLK